MCERETCCIPSIPHTQEDFPSYPEQLKTAISLGRRCVDPLLEFVALFSSPFDEHQSLKVHSLQVRTYVGVPHMYMSIHMYLCTYCTCHVPIFVHTYVQNGYMHVPLYIQYTYMHVPLYIQYTYMHVPLYIQYTYMHVPLYIQYTYLHACAFVHAVHIHTCMCLCTRSTHTYMHVPLYMQYMCAHLVNLYLSLWLFSVCGAEGDPPSCC